MKPTHRRRPIRAAAPAAILAPVAMLSTALALGSGSPAAAAGHSAGGLVHFYEAVPSLSSSAAPDVLTGAITDHGTDHEGVGGNGALNKIVLSKGTFEVSTAKLVSQPPPRVNATTCAFAATITAPIAIVKGSGTGVYKGIRGTITITITEAGILPRLSSGRCNEGQSATPVAGVSWAKGSGVVSFR